MFAERCPQTSVLSGAVKARLIRDRNSGGKCYKIGKRCNLGFPLRSTYLLVAHGSRDPRPQFTLEKLAKHLSERLANLTASESIPLVGTGVLELGPTPLHEQICRFGEESLALGIAKVQVVPLFLLPGVHVREDIPTEIAIAQQQLGDRIEINVRSHLGSHLPGLTQCVTTLMESRWDAKSSTLPPSRSSPTWILLAHGSRRPGANLPVEEIAEKVGAVTAYWSVPPSLEERVRFLISKGYAEIGIVPYFLFTGGIADAIANSLQQLKKEFPYTEFYLTNFLESSSLLVDLIVDLIQQ